MIGSFAGKVFNVSYSKIFTFKELKYEAKLNTEKTDVQGGKPTTNIKGGTLDTLACIVILNSQFGVDPRQEEEDLWRILNAAKPDFFILGGRPLGDNRWLLTGLTAPFENIDQDGNVNSIELSLTFEEYVKAGAPKTDSTAQEAVPGTAAGIETANPYNYGMSAETKVDLKRTVESSMYGLGQVK